MTRTSMRPTRDPWTEEELSILHNGLATRFQAKLLPNRSTASIQTKKKKLGISSVKPVAPPFTPEQIGALKGNTPIEELLELDLFFGFTYKALKAERSDLRAGMETKAKKIGRPEGHSPLAYDGRPVPLYQFVSSK